MSQQPAHLSDEDKYYLREGVEASPEGIPEDPQAQRVYTVDSNIIDFLVPIWTTAEVEHRVRVLAERHGLRIKLRWREMNGGRSSPGRGGGTILLNAERNSGAYLPVNEGEHVGSLVMHEFAHILTRNRWHMPERYGSLAFQGHGPEFVRTYLDLLAEHIDTRKAVAAFEFLGVEIAPEPQPSCVGGLT